MLWYLLAAALAGMVAAAFWDVRKKAREREAASKARFEQMFKEHTSAAPSPDFPSTAPAAAVPVAAGPALPAAPAIAAVPTGDRFLGQAETMIYGLLKAGIPDHEIFAKVMLASVVSAAGGGSQREQQMRRLSHYEIDFVVCDRDMRVVAAIEIEAAGGADAIGVRRFKADCLKVAGIRLVRIHAASPPRAEDIRTLIGVDPPPPSAA